MVKYHAPENRNSVKPKVKVSDMVYSVDDVLNDVIGRSCGATEKDGS